MQLSLGAEVRKLRECNDFSADAIKGESIDQLVQVGTLAEIETFHEFLMRDIYREEKPINFAAAFSQGREIDKKYYILPLRL